MNELFTMDSNGITFAVKITTKAKQNYIGDIFIDQKNQQVFKIYITTIPTDGKANAAIISLLAKSWKLNKNQSNHSRPYKD